MTTMRVTKEQARRIAAKLPPGRTLEDIRLIHCSGTATLVDPAEWSRSEAALLAEPTVARALADVDLAAGPPLLTNGKPTIMRVVAWMVHEGINRNRDAFEADDLGPAADAIRIPNLLPMDWNHAAFRSYIDAPKALGVWYAAEKRWDPAARDGRGAYGVLVQGIVWSWLFPEQATEMLAEQARAGKLDFSMACLPSAVTLTADADGPYAILHQPVFLTNSALDAPPADRDATGYGVEGSDDPALEQTLVERLTTAAATTAAAATAAAVTAAAAPATASSGTTSSRATPPVAQMTEEDMEELQAQLAALQAQVATLTGIEAQLAAREAELETVRTENEQLRAQVIEITTERDAHAASRTTAETALAALEATHAEALARLDEIAAAEEATRQAARYETRLQQLPEAYRQALEKRSDEERARFQTKWTAASDEDWSEFSGEMRVAFQTVAPAPASDTRRSYAERTASEGGALPNSGESAADMSALVAEIKR